MYRSCRIISGYFWIKWLHPCHWSNSSGLSHPSPSRVERCAWNGQRLHRRKGQCPSSCSNHTLVDMAQKWSCKGYTSCCLRLNHLIWAHLITEGHCMTNFHFALYNNTVQWWALQLLAIDPPNFCRATRCVRRSDHLAWTGLSLVGLSEIVEGTSVQVFVWPYLVKSWDLGALRIETSWNLQRVTRNLSCFLQLWYCNFFIRNHLQTIQYRISKMTAVSTLDPSWMNSPQNRSHLPSGKLT